MKTLHVTDFNEWRSAARLLLQQQVPPSNVSWSADQQTQLLFAPTHKEQENHPTPQTKIKVPSQFISLARAAACYRDEKRWALLYSVLWRLNHEEPHLLNISTDPETRQLKHMKQAINRDVHKMHAFVRFKRKQLQANEWYIAWFEPSHNIMAYTADFFVRRFNTMNWSILTPDACAHWDQTQLKITAGITVTDAQALLPDEQNGDDMDDYWRQYYRHIFNPARLKTQAMQSEMPKKYWHNLPEAELIKELTQQSGQRTVSMLNKELTAADRLRIKSKKLRQQQDAIRRKNQ